jgi:NADPH2:quinone reductase
MSIRTVPTHVPGYGQVLIRIAASGVNFIDIYVREGRYTHQTQFIPDRKLRELSKQ